MKLLRTGVTPRVTPLPAHFNHAALLELGTLRFEMRAAEALDLANRLVDAVEKHRTPGANS